MGLYKPGDCDITVDVDDINFEIPQQYETKWSCACVVVDGVNTAHVHVLTVLDPESGDLVDTYYFTIDDGVCAPLDPTLVPLVGDCLCEPGEDPEPGFESKWSCACVVEGDVNTAHVHVLTVVDTATGVVDSVYYYTLDDGVLAPLDPALIPLIGDCICCEEPDEVVISNTCDNPVPIEACEPLEVTVIDPPLPVVTADVDFVCNPVTGFFDVVTSTFTDGVQTDQTSVVSEVPCVAEPVPVVEVDVEYICNAATGLFDIITTTITDGVPDGGVTVASDVACVPEEAPVVDVDVEFVCNEATGFFDQVVTTITDGIPAAPVITATDVACVPQEVPQVDVDVEYVCNEATQVYDQVVVVTTDGIPAAPVITATDIACDTAAPVVEVDFEIVCNEATGFFDEIVVTTTDGVSDGGVTTATTIPCVAPAVPVIQIDKEFICNAATGFFDEVTTTTTDGVETDQTTVGTDIVCVEEVIPVPVVDVEVNYICNADTGLYDLVTTTITDGVSDGGVTTATTILCTEAESPDFEIIRRCNAATNTIEIVTIAIDAAGVASEVGEPVDTGERCGTNSVTESVCFLAPADTFEIDNGVTADCDINSGDFVAGDPWTFTWEPSAEVDGTFCYPCATENADGSWSITGTLVDISPDELGVDWGCPGVASPAVEGLAELPGYFIYEGVCYEIPAILCSGGNEQITITEHFSPIKVDKTHGPGMTAVYSDCETGLPIDVAGWIACDTEDGFNPNVNDACADKQKDLEPPASEFKECVKWQTLAVGFDNTKTRFDWNSTIELTNSDGTTSVFTQTAQAGWTQQIEHWAEEIQAIYPDCVVEPRCNIDGGCGGLLGPVSDAPLAAMFARYVHISCCPTGVYPVGAEIIEGDGVGRILVVDNNITPVKRGYFCSTCDNGNGQLKFDDGTVVPPADLPVCTFTCAEEIPDPVDPPCSTDTLSGNWCDLVESGDPEIEDEIEESEIIVLVTTCGTEQTVEYFTVLDGALEIYEPVGMIVDCETGEEPFVAPPECPEGAVFNPVEIKGSYFILDNSRWTGLPVNHLQNGNDYELTFTHADGSTTVVQQTANPYFANLRNEFNASDLGCTAISVCANHTAAAGCSLGAVANLAQYPAYDAPTAPGDPSNTLSNPDQNELWATGWLLDCGDCNAEVVRVEITNANDASHIGAYREPIVYQKPVVKAFQAVTCDGVFYKDCDGNDIPAPACCPSPAGADVTNGLEDCKTECGGNGVLDSAVIGHCGRPNNTLSYEYGDISGATLQEFTENWRAAGYCAWIADFDGIGGGECHWYAPAFPGTDFLVDGIPSDSQGDIVSPNPNPDICEVETEPALRTVGCADDRRDELLGAIKDCLPLGDAACATSGAGSGGVSVPGGTAAVAVGSRPNIVADIITLAGGSSGPITTGLSTFPDAPLFKSCGTEDWGDTAITLGLSGTNPTVTVDIDSIQNTNFGIGWVLADTSTGMALPVLSSGDWTALGGFIVDTSTGTNGVHTLVFDTSSVADLSTLVLIGYGIGGTNEGADECDEFELVAIVPPPGAVAQVLQTGDACVSAKLDMVIDKLCELVDLFSGDCEDTGGGDDPVDEKCELVDSGSDPGGSFGYSVSGGGTSMKSGPIAQSTVTAINNAIAAGYEVVIRLEGGGVVFAATGITSNVFTGGFAIEGEPATCVAGSDGDGTSADFVYEIYIP